MRKSYTVLQLITILWLLFSAQGLMAQAKYTLSGYVKDKETGEDLIGASVGVKELSTGSATNAYGHYALSLPAGTYTLRVSYVGYQTVEQSVTLDANKTLNIALPVQAKELKEVEITSDAPRTQIERTQMSKIELPISQVKQLPALFGEVDILKTLQLLPGVQSGGEGSTGFYVRGGGPDQNLIVLDEATVYNASHLFGFFSVFNSDAIRNVELYKGGFPPQFGGRLSSVVDINLKEGNNQKLQGAGGIGLIASRFTLEAPIVKGKSSFIISGRRTYFDLFTRAINKSNKDDPTYTPIPDYYFYDLNAKANFELGSKDRLFVSGYFGRDVFGFSRGKFGLGFNWGNSTATTRWNHVFSPKLFMNATGTFTDYRYTIGTTGDLLKFEIGSHIQDYTAKADFDYVANAFHTLKFGALATYHDFEVGRLQFETGDNGPSFNQSNTPKATELGLYGQDDWDINEALKLTYGLRLSGLVNKGTFYKGVEPRASMRYKVGKSTSLKASYTYMNQYVNLVSNSGASLPTDFWYPANAVVKPQKAQQLAAGLTTLLFKEKVVFSDEVYYKWMRNLIDFRNGAQVFFNPNLDQEFIFGKGWSYGNEVYIEKKQGKLTGWVGYTLSWSYRQFDSINNGEKFFPKYDRRHDISIVASYDISKRITLSATWVYSTGDLTTLPIGFIYLNDIPGSSVQLAPITDKRNNYRMAPYHRMDMALVYRFHPKWGSSDLTFSVYNLYNRLNPYLLYIEQNVSEDSGITLPTGATAKQISLFPVIPSITYNFKF